MIRHETLYQHASRQMKTIINIMLALSSETHNFSVPTDDIWNNTEKSILLLCGKGHHIDDIEDSLIYKKNAWLARSAIPFSIERAATALLYKNIHPFLENLVTDAYSQTNNFTHVTDDWIYNNPHFLPVIMHVMGAFSKRDLQKELGTSGISDNGISKPVSVKLANIFTNLNSTYIPSPLQVKERLKSTTEGIVRDLVGRLLLEDFVAQSLTNENIPFLREYEYEHISGVVYDFRADFVIPDNIHPRAFIEVRKSSAGHASLYAKDKMFSAINWKGKHQNCLGFIIVDGPWTKTTLETMTKVFDYVIPIEKANEAASKIKEYLDGNPSILRWLIQFKIDRNII